jgi:ubiquinone/menaquinone biosynthesis C-methylase UbiE
MASKPADSLLVAAMHDLRVATPMTPTAPHPPSPGKGIVKRLAEAVFGAEAWIARRWAMGAHFRLMGAQWWLKPSPEWFDHSIDLYYQWPKSGNPLWLERGAYGSLAIRGGTVLELASGDGFNTRNFYSRKARSIIACDFDPSAIATARRKNAAPNVRYLLADIRTDMPEGQFDNIVWDAAIEHFTPDEIAAIMANIKYRLGQYGVLSGYTLVEREDGNKHLHEHEYEFRDMADLRQFLIPHFKNVTVFETVYPERHNLYFWASDGPIPFREGWPGMIV